jgi:uncharacterized protein YraI
MPKQHTNIRLDASVLTEVDALAEQQDRSRAYILERAIIAGLPLLSGNGNTGRIENSTPAEPVPMSAKRTRKPKKTEHDAPHEDGTSVFNLPVYNPNQKRI